MRNNNIDKKFRLVDDVVSGDFVFDASGKSLSELFANCAYACFYAMTNPEDIKPITEHKFSITGENINELLFNFLSELIYLKDAESMFFSKYDLHISKNEKSLDAIIHGETINHDKHVIKTDVKAVTFYRLKIIKEDNVYSVRVILDL